MKDYDIMVLGAGSGAIIAGNAVSAGMQVALIEAEHMGGTCLNTGCIPSKLLIYTADLVRMIESAKNLGIHAKIEEIDFKAILKRTRRYVRESREETERSVESVPSITWYKGLGEFVSDYTIEVSGETVRADNIFIVTGTRPMIPPIKGLNEVDYLTNKSVLDLDRRPDSIIIIGGGYVAVEYGHFFSGMGTDVTIVEMKPELVSQEEPEISELLEKEMSRWMKVITNNKVIEVRDTGKLKEVISEDVKTGKRNTLSAEAIMVAVGRVPNSDILKPEKTGVETDSRGFVKVNSYLETSKENIWAFGDAIGKAMFKHVANYEAEVVWNNFAYGGHGHKLEANYSAIPHAVYGHPQIASVGLTENQAKEKGMDILVSKYYYRDTAKGSAIGEENGFFKVIVEKKTNRLLGGHIIGPYAPILIQEVINAMNSGDRTFYPIVRGLHIHPALPEVVQWAFGTLKEP